MGMTNGEKIKVILKPRTDQIRIYGDWVEIEIQSLGINFSCELSWWNAEYKEPTIKSEALVSLDVYKQVAWERDIAIQQLHELGYEFGQKIEPTTKNDLGVDAVSRTLVQSVISKSIEYKENPYQLYKRIERLPSVTPQEPRWIPVSERLPEIADVYRVTRYYPNNVMNPKYLVDACAFDGSNTWYNDNRINHERAYADNVVAWQENPEPYEPQEVRKKK